MLMLAAPIETVEKDAARAVKRAENMEIQTVTAETLSELLGLPGMKVRRLAMEAQGEEKHLHLFCEHEQAVAICPRCLEIVAGGLRSQRSECATSGHLGDADSGAFPATTL